MTVPTLSKRCNWRWTTSLQPVTTLVLLWVPRKLKWFYILSLTTYTKTHASQWKDSASKPLKTSCILAEHSLTQQASMLRPTTVFERRGISLATKLQVYRAVVLTTLLYWLQIVDRWHKKALNHFHVRCLRKLLNICWHEKIPGTEVLQWTSPTKIISIMCKTQVRWAGRITYRSIDHIPTAALWWALPREAHSKRVMWALQRMAENLFERFLYWDRFMKRPLLQTAPPGTAWLPLKLRQLKTAEQPQLRKSERRARPEQQASSTSHPLKSGHPVGEGSMPRLASSATSRHIVTDVMTNHKTQSIETK